MTKVLRILIIITVIIFVLVILLIKRNSKRNNKRKSIIFPIEKLNFLNTSNDLSADKIATVYTKLTDGVNKLLNDIGDLQLFTGSPAGSLNELNLKDMYREVENNMYLKFITIKYKYKDLILHSFAKSLNFSGTQTYN